MSTYELDDDLVRKYTELPSRMLSGEVAAEMQVKLSHQLPIPVPTKIGAIVETKQPIRGTAFYLRWAHDNATASPWIEAGNHEEPYRTDEIGRIVKVHSEGADL